MQKRAHLSLHSWLSSYATNLMQVMGQKQKSNKDQIDGSVQSKGVCVLSRWVQAHIEGPHKVVASSKLN